MKVCSVEEMRSLDREAIDRFLISEELLMENAGLSAYTVIRNEFGVHGKRFVVLCGMGNNGGDGFVVARKLLSEGGKVHIYVIGDTDKFKGAAKKNLEIVKRLPLEIESIRSIGSLHATVAHSDAIIDALFGTGITRELKGIYREVIKLINTSGKTVFSIDIPSGVNGDTGKPMGASVHASHTIAFGTPKLGNILYPGFSLCGKLWVSHISFPPPLISRDDLKIEINAPAELKERKQDGHKGDFGDVLFVAGAKTYYGAPYFSALSFLRAGGGYARLALPRSMCPHIASKGLEIVFVPQEETESGSISLKNLDNLLELSEKVDLLVVGCGLSLDDETQKLVRELLRIVRKPMIIDGDGISALCESRDTVIQREQPTVLTPHLGEMARLTKKKAPEIEDNRVKFVQDESAALGAVIVLKGAHSLIGLPDRRVYINPSGNSGMATAGSGDVLTGTVAAMHGLGLSIEDAARTGVFIHGLAGDLAAEILGEDGIIAQDILDTLPRAMKRYRESFQELLKDCYGRIHTV
jgi:hydroxyethylthiazole kinase-like uncharacterized protein yjeF